MEPVKVGGEIESWCTTCRTMKWHVVVAVVDGKPAKVECAGCHKHHVFRAAAPGTPKPRAPRGAKAASESAAVDDLAERLAAGERDARAYSPMDAYAVGDFVRHPTFGVGLVIALPAAQKVELAFRGGRKLLVHRRGEAAAAPALVRPPPRRDDEGPTVTDAPPPSPSPSSDRR